MSPHLGAGARLCLLWRRSAVQPKLEEKWKVVLFSHANSIRLWRAYLSYISEEISLFKLSKIVSEYHRAFKTFIGIQAGRLRSALIFHHSAERHVRVAPVDAAGV